MSIDLGVAVFARTPGSDGKSRLAATWGRKKTDIFYEHCLRCAGEWLQYGKTTCNGYWALTGDGSRSSSFWDHGEILEQCPGGLGQRMVDIAGQLLMRHRYWCIAGTDIPQMPLISELRINSLLRKADYVFAPATDGGFWLAAGRVAPASEIWDGVQYSRPDTLNQLTQGIKRAAPLASIEILNHPATDIDQQKDLFSLVKELRLKRKRLRPTQRNLLTWLTKELLNSK